MTKKNPIIREVTIGPCRLIQGDCLEVLPLLGKVDAVVTDPPYGIGVGSMSMGAGRKTKAFDSFEWDESPADVRGFIKWPCIVWGGNYFQVPPSGKWLCWDKGQEFSGADFELAYTNLSGPSKAFRMSRVEAYRSVERFHPTQKPVPLMQWCLGHLPDDAQTILDPFMGSGSTGVACIKTSRQFIGIEKEPKYFDIAVNRIRKEYREEQRRFIPSAKIVRSKPEGFLKEESTKSKKPKR